LINMPILKRHPILTGVTLSGKNLFGSWMESVEAVHPYLESSYTLGNPAPQTDLLAHEHIGGKTILYIGDGTFATKIDHATIGKFQMYPFNDDWTNSLYFSQDPVAIDSLMYDFLLAEGTNPSEGSQNYLHQSAEPPAGVYDPENDGVHLSDSLGVHEHWDPIENIFSSERYSGTSNNGIDYIAVHGEELEADADGPCYGLINIPVQFFSSATGGYKPYTWLWNFGDGTTSTLQNSTHTYINPGNYTVILTVTDDRDNTTSDSTWAKIKESNTPPNKPSISGPTSGKAGTPYDYNFVTTDPDNDKWLYYYIDWGDNSYSNWIGPYRPGQEITETHTWSIKGSYTIKAKAKDNYGGESDWGKLQVRMHIKYTPLILRLLERFPHAFPILRHLIGL
jgi:hypothetical protein